MLSKVILCLMFVLVLGHIQANETVGILRIQIRSNLGIQNLKKNDTDE